MLEKVIGLLQSGTYQVPAILLQHYKELKIEEKELILLIYCMNSGETFNPKKIGAYLNMNMQEVLESISSLEGKGLLKVDMVKVGSMREEHLNLDGLFNKLAFLVVNVKEETVAPTNLFDTFEKEFARTLSPIEYELINGWKDSEFTEELITLALKEAVYNGVTNLRYIDKILYEWKKKGIKTASDVEKSKVQFKTKKESQKELFDYDWLNENAE